jgi:protein SCO1/2
MNCSFSDTMPARPGAARLALAFTLLLMCAAQPATARLGADYYPNVPLVNQDGEVLHFYDDVIKDKVVTINFMFTSCGDSCPLETAKLREVQTMLGEHAGRDVYMYSITVDPDRDTPAALKAYMEKFNVGPGWQFLTGKKSDIDLVRKKLAMYSEDETELSDHAINFVLGNATTGRWLKRTPFDNPKALVATLLGRMQTRPLTVAQAQPDYAKTGRYGQARTGEDLFTTRCATCHTIGGGDHVGPDLKGVASSRDRAWLSRWLKEPDVMLKEKDPLATALFEQYGQVPMPNLKLTDENVQDLIDFMQDESRRVSVESGNKAADAR